MFRYLPQRPAYNTRLLSLRLLLIAIPSGLPVADALSGAKTDERETALAMIHLDSAIEQRSGRVLMADKG